MLLTCMRARITGLGDMCIQTKNLREIVEWLWTFNETRVGEEPLKPCFSLFK